MSGPWEYFQKKNPPEAQKDDHSVQYEPLSRQRTERAPSVFQIEIQKYGKAEPPPPAPEIPRHPQYVPVQPLYVPVQPQYVPVRPRYAPAQPMQGQTDQTRLPAGLEEFREKDGYDINGYVGKYGDRMPLIAGFKRQVTQYNGIVNFSEDEDINSMMTYAQQFGFARRMHIPTTNITVLHQFDMVVPENMPTGVPLNFDYRRLVKSERQVDTTKIHGEVYDDYSIEPGKVHKVFFGVATFTLLDGSQKHDRLEIIPLERRYPNRAAEISDMWRWFSSGRPGDDEIGVSLTNFYSLPQNFYSLPPRLQDLIRRYPSTPDR